MQPGTVFFRVFTDPNGHQKLISLSGGCILQLVILWTMFPTGQFSCTLQIVKESPLNRNVLFLHYTLLNLFPSSCFTFGNHSLSSEGNIKYKSYVKAEIFRKSRRQNKENKVHRLDFLAKFLVHFLKKNHSRKCTQMLLFHVIARCPFVDWAELLKVCHSMSKLSSPHEKSVM